MTSNIASNLMYEFSGKELRGKVMEALKMQFRPEFLNRIDEIVIFNSLDKDEIKKIVEIQLQYLQDRLIEKKISISFSDKIKSLIVDKGFDPIFGARPIKRTIQKMI